MAWFMTDNPTPAAARELPPNSMHYITAPCGFTDSSPGKQFLTNDWSAVTCGNCIRTHKARAATPDVGQVSPEIIHRLHVVVCRVLGLDDESHEDDGLAEPLESAIIQLLTAQFQAGYHAAIGEIKSQMPEKKLHNATHNPEYPKERGYGSCDCTLQEFNACLAALSDILDNLEGK